MKKQPRKLFGILLCAVIAAAATAICDIKIGTFSFELIGAPVIAILAGMLIALVCPKAVFTENHFNPVFNSLQRKFCSGRLSFLAFL